MNAGIQGGAGKWIVHLRRASQQDAPAIARIHVSGWRAAYIGLVPDEHLKNLSVERRLAYWSSSIANGEPAVWVADGEKEILGWIAFGRCRDEGAPSLAGEIWALYVSPSFWGGGVGRSLMNRAVEELRGTGFQSVSLWVLAGNHRARAFYAKSGFGREAGSVRNVNVGGAMLEEIRYVRHAMMSRSTSTEVGR